MPRRASLASLAALLAAACASNPTNDPAGGEGSGTPAAAVGEASAAQGPLAATLRLAATTVATGDSVRVRFAVRNASQAPVAVTFSCTAPAYLALVPAAGGEAVDGSGCGQAITERTLAAGAEQVMAMAFRAPAAGRYVVTAEPTVIQAGGAPLKLPPLRAELEVR
ncbi:hypothetical protein [Roseisolibacter sp. H3M3-2]|uniref:hypothetical protein n=1 Tax=Roseisolibacter sp. H3M3-2 TaxID=3031323 RepID=UPI0023DC25A3|nr:hypothetical protein [Roseisolibacter sp. H3M3-2]MDF1503091.1 hypothetical protein [Roseisolibacter sp. H3M3-2]